MSAPTITVVVNGNAYKLSATDRVGLAAVKPSDRQALLTLLEALKQCDQAASQAVEQAVAAARRSQATGPSSHVAAKSVPAEPLTGERMGSGDVDALMARLIAEDQQSRQSKSKPQTLIKAVAVLAAIIVLLVIIF